jgi:1-acyl-sn-glycerol-3-phosphate acyltransferase
MLYAILKQLVVLIGRLVFRLEARGRHHVPRRGATLIVANHSSVLDPPFVGAMAPRQLSFLAKEELFRIPLFGPFIRRLNARPLKRDGADPKALRTALRLLEEERALLVFPEGTRGEEGELRAPKAGAGMIAVLSGAPVVPAYIEGSGRVWPRGRKFPRPGKVLVRFGAPLHFERPTGRERKEQYEAASRAMMDAIRRLKESGESARPPSDAGLEYIHGRNGQHG